jgi:hypothetical protein
MSDKPTNESTDSMPEWRRLAVLHDQFREVEDSDLELYATWDKEGEWLHLNFNRSDAITGDFIDKAVVSLSPYMQRQLRDNLVEMKLGGEDNPLQCTTCDHEFDPMKDVYRCEGCREEDGDG